MPPPPDNKTDPPDPQIPPSSKKRRKEIKDTLEASLISEPLRTRIEKELSAPDAPAKPPATYEVIIELNVNYPGGRPAAREAVLEILNQILGPNGVPRLQRNRPESSHRYVFATLTAVEILQLITRDGDHARAVSKASEPTPEDTNERHAPRSLRAVFRIWESQKVGALTTVSIRTVRAQAAHNSFHALGEKVVWAILDSGVDASHPHFKLHANLDLPAPLSGRSTSFTASPFPWDKDAYGHGTHVAGIIAGESDPSAAAPQAAIQAPADSGDSSFHLEPVPGIKGMAPLAKLLILRVLDDGGDGDETALIEALEYIQQLNDFGRHIVVHGVNISVGFPAHPTWYACGQTPLCTEVNRLVRSGVVVVVAAGNTGHVVTYINEISMSEAGQFLSINDPGNAELAITVGSTHRVSPGIYGISYFSSKGPTSDGRRKPELVAPGEKIISAASSQKAAATTPLPGLAGAHFDYLEDTGTSMAAPHVSGVVAALLSYQPGLIGRPEDVRSLLTKTAMDLGRDPDLQGAGLVDLFKLLECV